MGISAVLYTIAIMGCIANLRSARDKNAINTVVLICMLLVCASVASGYDTENLIAMYSVRRAGNTQQFSTNFFASTAAYMAMMDFFSALGVRNFGLFKLITTLMVAPLAVFSLKRTSVRLSFVLLFYLLFSFWIDVTQPRTMLAMILFVFGSKYLLLAKARFAVLKYLFVIAVCTMLHITFAYFFVFAVLFIENKRIRDMIVKFFTISAIAVYVYLFVGGGVGLLFRLAEQYNMEKLIGYLQYRTRFGSLYPLVIYVITLTVSYYCYFAVKNRLSTSESTIKDAPMARVLETALNINLLLAWTMPICVITLSAMRLVRINYIITLIAVWCFLSSPSVEKKRKVLVIGALLLLSFFFLYMENAFLKQTDDIILSTLRASPLWIFQ